MFHLIGCPSGFVAARHVPKRSAVDAGAPENPETFGPTRAISIDSMASPLKGEIPETILVVEDDAAILRLVQTILEEAGFEVLAASSVENAIRVEAHFSRTIHLLLSDIMMPDMCGPDLADVLKQRRPEMRVMLMSGYADGAMLVLNHGWHFIQKPFLPAALVRGVIDVLHTKVRDQGTDHFDPRK
jgi:DNA-binding NtrC family response regulator